MNEFMRRHIPRIAFSCLLLAAPAVLAADDAPDPELHAAYCYGAHLALEQFVGDVCIEAGGGWENECSPDVRQRDGLLAYLRGRPSFNSAAFGTAVRSGQQDFKQCGQADAGAACERLRQCEE